MARALTLYDRLANTVVLLYRRTFLLASPALAAGTAPGIVVLLLIHGRGARAQLALLGVAGAFG